MMKTVDAIIIGKNYSTSLGIIKALGEQGYLCAVIKLIRQKPKFKAPDVKSKYVVSYVYAQDLNDQSVLAAIKKYRGSTKRLIIPSDDYSASLLDRFYDELCDNFYVPNMSEIAGNLSAFMDKHTQKKLAEKFGIHVAKCWTVDVCESHFCLPEGIVYPCFTKPQKSIGASKSFIKKCENQDELIGQLNRVMNEHPCRMLVEEAVFVENEYTVPGVSLAGNVIIPAFLKKVKIGSGEHKGVTAKGIVEDASNYSEVITNLCKYIGATRMTGLFDIELLESRGIFYLNEVNLRYGAAGYAVTVAGTNLPGMYANHFYGKESALENTIQEGKVFVSEKAQLDDYEAGFCSWNEYRSQIKQADIRFMYGGKDPASQRAFKLLELKTRLKKLIKRKR